MRERKERRVAENRKERFRDRKVSREGERDRTIRRNETGE